MKKAKKRTLSRTFRPHPEIEAMLRLLPDGQASSAINAACVESLPDIVRQMAAEMQTAADAILKLKPS